MENNKTNNKVVLLLLIIIICLLAGGGFLLYALISDNSNVSLGGIGSSNQQMAGGNDTVNLVTYNDGIPQVNLNAAKDFNDEVKKNYGLEVNNDENFVCALKDEILYCSYLRYWSAGMDGSFATASFIYDLVNNKTMTVKDILTKYNMGIKSEGFDEGMMNQRPEDFIYIMPTVDGVLKAYAVKNGPSGELYHK